MKWPAIGFWAVLTEVLAHVLSLSWGFGMLVVAFIWVAGTLRATTVKAQSTEARVSTLVTKVATVNGTANSALSTANGCLPLTGGTISGALTVAGNIKSHSDLLADGTLFVNGSSWQLNWPQARATGLTACPNPPTQAWGNTVVSAITQLNVSLVAAGDLS